ncbi:MAG: hypothetical protein OEM77_01625 [Nitrosopumilus sp.]|nr:hypothetical protein [Nitrosopumilus sp.]MDH3736196.1 hypothetical protein [Nitrosopumilus sp.]MDH3822530.1 hypothetical protein [Nitrosopumilus sp.]MDH3833467.1 hypothetical protein [Nitrosopumilus sp.]
MNLFVIGVIATVGFLAIGIVYLAGFDENSERTLQDIVIIDSLNNMVFGMDRDNGIHYERVDREEKYYASMTDIKLIGDDSIQITFDENHFQFGRGGGFVKPDSDGSSEFVATINKGQTFVAGCNSSSMPDFPHDENIPAKQLHVLKYIGITEKNGTDYHGFVHQGGYVSDDMDCKFPEMIQYSVGVEFDINMENHYYGEVWDHDWD